MSEIHEFLKSTDLLLHSGTINLYDRITEIKKCAKGWLSGLEKNGYEHSERLEGYLDSLTKKIRDTNSISPEDLFILLCAIYMHDIGYKHNNNVVSEGHAKRSRDMILANPSEYCLGDFPIFDEKYPRVAAAVGCVCYGHSLKVSLDEIPDLFPDQVFASKQIRLRKLTALLRLADEADDPYIRSQSSHLSLRNKIPLVKIDCNTIVWYWDTDVDNDANKFQRYIDSKKRSLSSTLDYLDSIGVGKWYIVTDPQIFVPVPFMAEDPVVTFVGRSKDLEKIHLIVKEKQNGNITVIVGTGGIGKTELARMYAKKFRNAFPDGVFWASLNGSTWREEAVKIISALSQNENTYSFPDKKQAIDSVVKVFQSLKNALLIIDNLDEPEDVVNLNCSILVTTRNKSIFHFTPSDAIYELAGISIEDGITLIRKIIGSSRVDQDQIGASHIVEILGGMPLAIEIVAQHIKEVPDLTFPEHISQIRNKVEKLKIDGTDNKNVLLSLELSLDQLKTLKNGEKLQLLFEAASICATSGFTSQTLGAAADFDSLEKGEIKQLVSKLHQRSLLEFDSRSQKYSMHPLLRQIAEKNLSSNLERKTLIKRNYCIYFYHFVQMHNSDFESLIIESDGIWEALVYVVQLDGPDAQLCRKIIQELIKPYYDLINQGQFEKALGYLIITNLINIDELGEMKILVTLLEPLLDNLKVLSYQSQMWILSTISSAHGFYGDNKKAIEIQKQVLKISRDVGDKTAEENSFGNMGLAYANVGEFHKAINCYNHALKIAEQIGDLPGKARAFNSMGLSYSDLSDDWKAIEKFENALVIAQRIGDIRSEGIYFGNLGLSYAKLGKNQKAIELFNKGLEIAERFGDAQSEARYFGNLGLLYVKIGNFNEGISSIQNAIKKSLKIGDIRNAGIQLSNLGFTFAAIGKNDLARECLDDSKKMLTGLDLNHIISRIETIEKNMKI